MMRIYVVLTNNMKCNTAKECRSSSAFHLADSSKVHPVLRRYVIIWKIVIFGKQSYLGYVLYF